MELKTIFGTFLNHLLTDTSHLHTTIFARDKANSTLWKSFVLACYNSLPFRLPATDAKVVSRCLRRKCFDRPSSILTMNLKYATPARRIANLNFCIMTVWRKRHFCSFCIMQTVKAMQDGDGHYRGVPEIVGCQSLLSWSAVFTKFSVFSLRCHEMIFDIHKKQKWTFLLYDKSLFQVLQVTKEQKIM